MNAPISFYMPQAADWISAKSPELCGSWGRIEAAPKSATNTLRGLTPSLKLAERG